MYVYVCVNKSQKVIPESVTDVVQELFVPADKLADAQREAETLPAVEVYELT